MPVGTPRSPTLPFRLTEARQMTKQYEFDKAYY
jgi:hypothetical protein